MYPRAYIMKGFSKTVVPPHEKVVVVKRGSAVKVIEWNPGGSQGITSLDLHCLLPALYLYRHLYSWEFRVHASKVCTVFIIQDTT